MPPDDPVSRVVNRLIILLIIVNLVAVVLQSVPAIEAAHKTLFAVIEIVSLVVFTIEYLLRLWVAAEHAPYSLGRERNPRLAYATSAAGLVDLVSVLPFWLGLFLPADLRMLLVLRAVRFLKLVRYSPAMRSLLDALYAERRALFGVLHHSRRGGARRGIGHVSCRA